MSLDFDFRSVPDDAKTDPFDKDKIHPVLYWLIWAMIPIGMHGITKENKRKVYQRLVVYQKMTGPALKFGDGTQLYVTLADVERYVGLSVNVTNENDAKFLRKVLFWANDDWYKVTEQHNPDQLTACDYLAKRAEKHFAEQKAEVKS